MDAAAPLRRRHRRFYRPNISSSPLITVSSRTNARLDLQRAGSHTPEMVSLDARTRRSLREMKQYKMFVEKDGKGRYQALPHHHLEELAGTNHLVIFEASGELSRLVLAPKPGKSLAYLRDASAPNLFPTRGSRISPHSSRRGARLCTLSTTKKRN